jgi:hypothetical protein
MPASLTSNLYKDPGLNKFKKTNLYYTSEKYLLYQDPTWLGFKLLFFFDQPESRLLYSGPKKDTGDGTQTTSDLIPNTAYTYLKNIGDEARADYLSKFVDHLRNINQITPWFFQTIEGLGDAWKRGFQDDDFKSMLPKDRKITIGCLESIDLRMSALMDFYRKACFDWKFRREIVPWNLRTFSVYIYIYELRNINRSGMPSPSGMLDLSKMAGIPDINARQQLLNENLLGKDIFGDDSGKSPLQNLKDKAASTIAGVKDGGLKGIKNAISPSAMGNESSNTINPYINRFLFKFDHCEWLPDESSAALEKVSASVDAGNMTTQKLVFTYRDVEEVNLYNIYSSDRFVQDSLLRLLDSSALDNKSLTGAQEKGSNVALYGNLKSGADPTKMSYGLDSVLNGKYNALLPFASLAADKLERLASSFAGKLLMGNVYGFSATNVLGAAQGILSGDPTAVLRGGEDIINTISGSKSLRNNTKDVESLGNIFD